MREANPRALRHPLRDALAAPDAAAPVSIISGIVVGSSKATTPYTVTLRLADGSETPPLTYPAWWVPRVDDIATMLYQAGALHIVSVAAPAQTAIAPHRHQQSDIDGTVIVAPPTPPPAPAPPPPPPSRRTVDVQPTDRGSWGTYYPTTANEMRQGGPDHDAFWFYGTKIAAAKGSGTIVGGSIWVQRLATSHGVSGAANVRLGTHNYTARPAAAGGISNVAVVGQLERGAGYAFALTSAQIAALNAGADGLGLAHGGTSFASPDYLRATTDAASGALSLTIEG